MYRASRALVALASVALLGTLFLGVDRLSSSALLNIQSAETLPGWTDVTSNPSPPAMAGAMMAYSWRAERFVLFGGWDGVTGLNGTWVYDPGNRTWNEIHPLVIPLARGDGMLVYDGVADAFILFGGWHEQTVGTYSRLSDTWFFYLTNTTWMERHPSASPSPRSDALVAYDHFDDIVLLVGGFNGTAYLGDVWGYSARNGTWFPRASAVLPPPRADGRMIYVDEQDRFILFGGNDFSGPNYTFHHLADTWSYGWRTNAWTPLTKSVGPGARDYPVFAFNPKVRLGLLTSGFGNGTILGDLWGFNIMTDEWIDLTPQHSPPSRFAAVGGFDLGHDVLVLFSGLANAGLLADTWHYAYGPLAGTPSVFPLTELIGVGLLVVGIASTALLAVLWRRRSRDPS